VIRGEPQRDALPRRQVVRRGGGVSTERSREVTAMRKLVRTLFGLATVAAAMFPVIVEAGIIANHNETLVRESGRSRTAR
jgi:hypothetical protein